MELQKWFLCQKCHPALCPKASLDLGKKRQKAKVLHAYRRHIYALCTWSLRPSASLYLRSGVKCSQKPRFWPLSGLHWPIYWRPRPKFELAGEIHHIYLHTKINRPKANSFWVIARRRKSLQSIPDLNVWGYN